MATKNKWTHEYVGPTLESDRAGAVGIANGTRGRVVTPANTDGLVEFEPSWGADWITVYLNADEVTEL